MVWKFGKSLKCVNIFVLFSYINEVKTFKCIEDTLIECVQGTIVYVSRTRLYTCPRHNCICVQDTVVYVPRARLYMCPGHNHRTRIANVTEAHFNQTIVLPPRRGWFCIRDAAPLSSLTSKISSSFIKHLQPARHPFKFNYFPWLKLQWVALLSVTPRASTLGDFCKALIKIIAGGWPIQELH